MNIPIEVITRDQAAIQFGITDAEFDAYLSEDAAKDFKAGKSTIPQMPHRPGRPVKFLTEDLREWLRTYLHKGGATKKERCPTCGR
jgi:hypothetical protein